MHAHLEFILPLVVLSATLLRTTSGASPLYTICSSSSGNYSSNDAYAKNLQTLTTSLINNAPATGFSYGSAGKGTSSIFGLTLCRGDIRPSQCKICITEAASMIRQECPNQKEAITWYDNCLFRYSDQDFSGIVSGPTVYLSNTLSVPKPEVFNKKVVNLLNKVTDKASRGSLLFATQEAKIGGESETIYALAQCTRDLSAAYCKSCLRDAISQFPNCCAGKRGGRVLGASCNFRYELYPFYAQG